VAPENEMGAPRENDWALFASEQKPAAIIGVKKENVDGEIFKG